MDTITGVARIFSTGGGGGAKRGSEATQWAEGVCFGGQRVGRGCEIFENSCIKMIFLHIKCLFLYRISRSILNSCQSNA